MDAMTEIMRALWIGGLAATPLALAVGVVCRAKAWSAATRHLLWLAVLVSFVTPALGWFVWRPNWFGTERLLGAAETVIAQLPVKAETVSPSPEKIASASPGRKRAEFGDQSGNRAMPTTTFVGPVLLPSFTPENAARFSMGEPRTLSATPMGGMPMASRYPAASGYKTSLSNIGAVNGGAVNSAAPLGLAPAGAMRMEQPARARIAATSPRVSERKDAKTVSQPATPIDVASNRSAVASTASTTTPTVTAAKEAAAAELLRKSVASLISMRDSLASASPIPMTLWLGVAALLIAVRLTRTIRASRLIRASEPASLRTCAMVAVAAEQIGLSRVPEVRIVNDAVSPMIWCGFRPKLILPRGLWNALDESSQRAVLVHELAHVRRWDHVLCWFDLVIGSLYWWHPLSWWARRRLHDEAEASCDAWVVNTLPESRRAYATALLATKSFVSMKGRVNGPWLAAGGVGVMSGSAKKMARRITMVMCEKSASKLSLVGAGAAACVIALGAFVMPGLACPPEEHASKHSAEHAEKKAAELANASGNVIIVTPDNKAKVKLKKDAPGAHGGQAGMQFFGEAPALEAMKTRKGAQGFSPMAPMAPVSPTPPAAPTPPVPPVGPSGAMFRVGPNSVAVAKSGQCGASRSKVVMSSDDWKTGRVARVYVLPEGKSEAFYELMSRSDVPILVQQKGNSIVVFATEGQHPTIDGFIKIISPGTSSDPIRGSRGSGQSAGRNQSAANARADSIRAYQEQARGYQQALRELNASRANIERNATRARGEAERVRAQQEQLEAAAEQMAEQAEQMEEGKARQKLEQAAEKLRQRAEAAEGKSRGTDEQVENIEQQIEELENQAEELEQRAEELQDRISEISEMDDDDRIAELDSEVSAADSLMVEMNEGDEVDEPGEVMVEIDESPAPDMDDEEEADEPEGTPVPAPFAPIPPSNSAFSPAPIPSATPIAPVATPAAGSAATSASPIGTPVPAAAPTPSATPSSTGTPAPAAPKGQATPAAASVIAATRKA